MRIDDGRWVCVQCGAVVDMPFEAAWHTEMRAHAGEPNVRVVIADGHEVHRCALPLVLGQSEPAA